MEKLPKIKKNTKLTSGEYFLIDTKNGLWNIILIPTAQQLIDNYNSRSDKKWEWENIHILDTKDAVKKGILKLENDKYSLTQISYENCKNFIKGQKK
mgnify:CR=1 FL=1